MTHFNNKENRFNNEKNSSSPSDIKKLFNIDYLNIDDFTNKNNSNSKIIRVIENKIKTIENSEKFYKKNKELNNRIYLRDEKNKKNIFIDGHNFTQKFLKIGNSDHSCIKYAKNKIKKFMKVLKSM